MKLLSKLDVTRAKVNERKIDIEEGAKLARKIDTLRETSSREQDNLKKFKDESVKELHKEVLSKQAEIEELNRIIEVKKKVKEELEKPLTDEWQKINDAIAELEKKRKQVESDKITNEKWYLELGEKNNELKKEKHTIQSKEIYLDKQINEAVENNNKSKESLKRQQESEERIKLAESELIKVIEKREVAVAIRETEAKLKEESNKRWESELINKDKEIKDRYETLQRTITRINKN